MRRANFVCYLIAALLSVSFLAAVQAQTDVSQYTMFGLSLDSKCSNNWAYWPRLVTKEECTYGVLGNQTYYWAKTASSGVAGSVVVNAQCDANTCDTCKVKSVVKSQDCVSLSQGIYATAFRPEPSRTVNIDFYENPDCSGTPGHYPVKGAICRDGFATGSLYVGFDGASTIGLGRYCGEDCKFCPVFDRIPLNSCVFVYPGMWAKGTR